MYLFPRFAIIIISDLINRLRNERPADVFTHLYSGFLSFALRFLRQKFEKKQAGVAYRPVVTIKRGNQKVNDTPRVAFMPKEKANPMDSVSSLTFKSSDGLSFEL